MANPYKPGDGATVCGYSDRQAFTVLKVTARSITIQRDKAVLLNGFKSGADDALTFTPGGFCGHTEGTQRYTYERDPNGEILVARMRQKPRKVRQENPATGNWEDMEVPHFKTGCRTVIEGRAEFYDFNF